MSCEKKLCLLRVLSFDLYRCKSYRDRTIGHRFQIYLIIVLSTSFPAIVSLNKDPFGRLVDALTDPIISQ